MQRVSSPAFYVPPLKDKMHSAKLVWATPNSDEVVAYIARVSNPANQANKSIEGLLQYMQREGHVSPFTMSNFCVEVNTTRAIARQILRHWSLMPQEFSQRYADASVLDGMVISECRMQDTKNRQNSFEGAPDDVASWWEAAQQKIAETAASVYDEAVSMGIAKEQARNILPEGLTPSRLYFNGNLRSWIFYLKERLKKSTQKEHRMVAVDIANVFKEASPVVYNAFFADVDLSEVLSNGS